MGTTTISIALFVIPFISLGDNTLPIFYSGSKDGHIKAGVICKEKI